MSSFKTYAPATIRSADIANGLTTTNQGGEAYGLDNDLLSQLKRFLILGTEGNTLYEDEKKRTNRNVAIINKALDAHGTAVIDLIVEVSDKGIASNNDPALVALAHAISYKNADSGLQDEIRGAVRAALPKVVRTGTHLFHFAAFTDALRGWGPGLRSAFNEWYLAKSPMALANQITKYQQRDGWSHRDILRKTHPVAPNEVYDTIFGYAVSGLVKKSSVEDAALEYLSVVNYVKELTDTKEIVSLIEKYNLPREVLPTTALNAPEVWEALLMSGRGMPLHAMLRNLGNMTKNGILDTGSSGSRYVMDRLEDADVLRASRLHPIDVIKAKLVYQSNAGLRGHSTWQSNPRIVDTLETAFYKTFDNVTPTNKSGLIALDVSSSMTIGEIGGIPGFNPRLASVVMAMVTMKVERDYELVGFTSGLADLSNVISSHDSLNDAINKINRLPFGGTDCSLPMKYAASNKKNFDYFIVYTDSETGYSNPSEALRAYRKTSGIHDSKLIVVGMVANQFSIADPSDRNMLDCVGFSTDAPAVMSEFIRGNI